METKEKYSRFSKIYDFLEEKLPMNIYKKEAVSMLTGKILEIGIGSGANLKYFNNNMDITGVDFSSGMLKIAQDKANSLGLKNVTLLEMNIENMVFPDETFDSILSTCVFCTVPNPEKGLTEVYRVLKKGGKAVFLEHMKSKNIFINICLFLLTAIVYPLIGTSFIRETEKKIKASGFSKVECKNLMMGDVLKIIVAEK